MRERAPLRSLAALAAAAIAAAAPPSWLAGPVLAASGGGPPECRAGPARADTLEEVGPRGEIGFTSGARAVLDSLRWPDTGADAEAARAWLAAWRGIRFVVVPRGEPDRWGRERVDALADPGEIDLAGGLVGAGLAFADANEADTLCRPAMRAVEAGARDRRLGLWRANLPDAEDGTALRALAGRFVVVEGRVRHIGERATRTYLDFAARGADGLTVTVTKRTWRMMGARGLSADSLQGHRVRVRGLLDVRRGPILEAAADAVEVLGEADRPEAGPDGKQGLRR